MLGRPVERISYQPVQTASPVVRPESYRSIHQVIGRPLNNPLTIRLFHAVLQKISVLHEQGRVHGQLTPDNIACDLSRTPTGNFWHIELLNERQGEMSYAPPEAVTPGKLDPARDVYTLGLVFFEALTGEQALTAQNLRLFAFEREAFHESLAKRTNPALLRAVGRDSWAWDLLSKMARLEPATRPSSEQVMEEMFANLQALAKNYPL
jgi:serine/threonine protein kinase